MNTTQLISKTPIYYARLIILALVPQIFGFNSSGLGDLWKVIVLLSMLFLLSNTNGRVTTTNTGIMYIVFFIGTNIASLVIDTSINPATFLNIGISVLMIYLFFDCPIREKNIREEDILKFFKMFAYFMIIACIYNILRHPDQLLHISSNTVYGDNEAASFFDNKNTFGLFLTFGTISAIYLRVVEHKAKWMFPMLLFLVNELMAMCRTAIILTTLFLIISFLVGNKKTILVRIFMLILIFIVGLIFYSIRSGLYSFINENLFGNTDSLDVREGYIESMLPLANGIHLLLGYGDNKSRELAYIYTGNPYYHNTYLHLLIHGGLLKLGFFAVGVIYSLINSLKLFRMNKKNGYMCLVTIASYLAYASVESIVLFDTPVLAMVATIFVISIPRLFLNAEIFSRKLRQGDYNE